MQLCKSNCEQEFVISQVHCRFAALSERCTLFYANFCLCGDTAVRKIRMSNTEKSWAGLGALSGWTTVVESAARGHRG